MKKITALLLALAMAMTLVACGSGASTEGTAASGSASASAAQGSGAAAGERTQLIVGFDAEFPPYGYLDEETNDYTGLDLDLAQAVCDYYGWELKKQPIDWDSKDMELDSGSIDCIWNGFTMTGREEEYTWSAPYIDNSQVVIVKGDSGIKTIDDLAGKVMDTQKDSSALAALEGEDATEVGQKITASLSQLIQVADYNTAFMDLEAGAVDAIALDVGVANYQVASRGGDFFILDEEISSEQYGIGFKKGNTELCEQVEAALKALTEDGTIDEIIAKWSEMDDGAYSYLADTWCYGAE
ncbi:MAG: amino acid ABC transporter substrate-binding protein [Eubacteriales bacterium]|nr:amino acid ABC transporter substrate-binding protein [Eubacteriales bacterium]